MMTDLLVKRGERPSARQRQRRDALIARQRPRAGRGLRQGVTDAGTLLAVDNAAMEPSHPWRCSAMLWPTAAEWAIGIWVEPGWVNEEEAVLPADAGSGRSRPVRLSDHYGQPMHVVRVDSMLTAEIKGVPAFFQSRRDVPGADGETIEFEVSLGGRPQRFSLPRPQRTLLGCSVYLHAHALGRLGERYQVLAGPDVPRISHTALAGSLAAYFALTAVAPQRRDTKELAMVWALAPLDDPQSRTLGPGWELYVEQRTWYNLSWRVLPEQAAPFLAPLQLDPSAVALVGRYTAAPIMAQLEMDAVQQLAVSEALHRDPLAGWWT